MYRSKTLIVGLLLGVLVLPACSGNRSGDGPRPRGDRGDWIGVWGDDGRVDKQDRKDKKPKKAKKNKGKGNGKSRGNGGHE